MNDRIRILPVFVAALLIGLAPDLRAASGPPIQGTGGAVASDEAAATAAGIEILRRGGNAVDAAVATALALAVVEPQAGNLGGGGFAVVKLNGQVTFLDFRETAPAGARGDLFLDADGEPIPDASLVGPLAAGVPGSPSGLRELHRRHGRLPWPQVVEPARRLADEGFVVSRLLHRTLEEKKELLARFPETAATWLPDGEPPEPGQTLRLPALGSTLAAFAERGADGVVTGAVAAAVVAASRRHGGILTSEDLVGYRPQWRQPVRFEAFGWQVAAASLPSSGGILLGASLGMLERLGWSALPRFGADRDHLLAEVLRRVFADRFLLGDPSAAAAGAAELLAPDRLAARVESIDRRRATASAVVEPRAPGPEPGDTTHVSVVDADGGIVALTTTLNGLFGCGLFVPEAGFFLNNEMDDFATAPGRPNLFGLVQGEANAVAPGKRMLSSMSPTIVWRAAGEEAIALGGRGGSRIPSAVLQVLLNVWIDGDGLQAALDRPRIHHQWLPDTLFTEPDALHPETRAALERMGHRIGERETVAKVQAVRWLDGHVEAASDPRIGGGAAVVDAIP